MPAPGLRPILPAALLLLLAAACATPQVPAIPPPGPSLGEAEIDERLAFIESRLEERRQHAQWWHVGWLVASAGGVVVGTAQAALSDGDDADLAAGITTAVLAVGGIAYVELLPMEARHGADPVRALPDDTREEKLARLARAQEQLVANAERATVSRDWVAHAANAAVSLAAGGIVWGVSGESGPAAVQFATALVGGEVQFWTEPHAPYHDAVAYHQRFFGGGLPGTTLRLVPTDRGIALRLDF